MKLFSRHPLLLLLAAQLALALTVQGGFLDFIDKNKKDKSKTNDDANQKADRQAEELADELHALNQVPVAGKVDKMRRPDVDLESLLEKANEFTKYNPRPAERKRSDPSPRITISSRDIPADLPPELMETDDSADPEEPDASSTSRDSEKPLRRVPKPKMDFLIQNNSPYKSESSDMLSSAVSKLTSASYLKRKMKGAYKTTKESLGPVKNTLANLPKTVGQATDSVTVMLKLDKGAALREMMQSLDKSIRYIREEFSLFSIEWAPRMEAAVNYIGLDNLYKLKWNDRDELDLRRDALNLLGFGYEFMNMMMSWRENLLTAHEAFRVYLMMAHQEVMESEETKVDDNLLYKLEAIHNYIIFRSWLQIDAEMLEPRMKLNYLSNVNDKQQKNYESDYFRHIVFFQELLEPRIDEFEQERKRVRDAVSAFGDAFEDVDNFLDEFQSNLSEDEDLKRRIEVPQELADFMDKVRPEVVYNPRLYQKHFLEDLKEMKKRMLRVEV